MRVTLTNEASHAKELTRVYDTWEALQTLDVPRCHYYVNLSGLSPGFPELVPYLLEMVARHRLPYTTLRAGRQDGESGAWVEVCIEWDKGAKALRIEMSRAHGHNYHKALSYRLRRAPDTKVPIQPLAETLQEMERDLHEADRAQVHAQAQGGAQ